MQRRLFLQRLTTLTDLTLVAPLVKAQTARRIELQRSPLAGFQYHQGAALWPLLHLGATLELAREPDNPFDDRAVRLDFRGGKLGYVPRGDNAAVSHLLDQHRPLGAEIVALRDSADPWERIQVAVFLEV